MLCRYTYAHFMHITIKTLQMREAQEVQSCARICPCSVTSLLTLTSPGDSPWNPNPDSVPFTHFFPGLNYPLCPVSSPSWDLQESFPTLAVGWAHHIMLEPWGQHTPFPWGQGRGQAPSPAEGSPHKHLPPANLAQLSSSGRTLPQHNSARLFHPSLLCNQPAIPEFTMEKRFINSWITSVLIS